MECGCGSSGMLVPNLEGELVGVNLSFFCLKKLFLLLDVARGFAVRHEFGAREIGLQICPCLWGNFWDDESFLKLDCDDNGISV